jgi:hypothetical protein
MLLFAVFFFFFVATFRILLSYYFVLRVALLIGERARCPDTTHQD